METSIHLKKTARLAGLLFLLWILSGFYNMYFVSPKIFVKGDDAASVQNMLAHQVLFRSGIFMGILASALWIFLVWVFYRLFKSVNENYCRLLLSFVVVQIPVALIAGALSIAALALFKGEHLEAFTVAQQQALGMFLIKINDFSVLGLELFWGLWLLPLAVLVYRSGFIPKGIGIWLMFNCAQYVILCFVSIVVPQFKSDVFWYGMPAMFGELVLMFWLLIIGARTKKVVAPRVVS